MEESKKFWERFACLYTKVQGDGTKGLYKEVNDTIKGYLKPSDKVIEIGTGTGQMALNLFDIVENYIATDFSPKMIEEAKKNNPKVDFRVCDATNLDFADESFDVSIIANTLHIMPSPELALKEIKRVLKKDGLLIAPTFVYEGKVNKFKLWVLEHIGFKQYHKFSMKEYIKFIEDNGFTVIDSKLIKYDLLPEGFVVAKGRYDE